MHKGHSSAAEQVVEEVDIEVVVGEQVVEEVDIDFPVEEQVVEEVDFRCGGTGC
jgi:hypothetical protein